MQALVHYVHPQWRGVGGGRAGIQARVGLADGRWLPQRPSCDCTLTTLAFKAPVVSTRSATKPTLQGLAALLNGSGALFVLWASVG